MPSHVETLRSEHAVLQEALAALLHIAESTAGGGPFPAGDMALILRFLREFIGGVHARKENEVVFPAVAMHAEDRAAELVGTVLRLQEDASELLHMLSLFWEPDGSLSAEERLCFLATARSYASRMQRLLSIEEQHLFPAVENRVPADDRLSWSAEFAAIEAGRQCLAHWQSTLQQILLR
jgi:hemerythrin-like domain-containing protein